MYRAVEATRDILPGEVERWQYVERTAHDLFRLYGFREIRTPIFEFTELFSRSVGEETDIVSKEMYTFEDRGGRSLTLRPEGTAPAVRAYVEHSVHRSEDVTRWYYVGPMFRYERKQKGRYRQFAQIGAESLGSDSPLVDVEVIEMVMHFLQRVGIQDLRLQVNSIGCAACRSAYRTRLVKALEPNLDDYCRDCHRRFKENVLRVLDCKIDRERIPTLPAVSDHLCDDCARHFGDVRTGLKDAGVAFTVVPHLVRGLDYYVRTTFEVSCEGLGAQNALLGGGRYDGLVERLGGPAIPGFGFALGIDRLVMLLPEATGAADRQDVHLVIVGEAAVRHSQALARRLRHRGLSVGGGLEPRSVKAQMRRADRMGARFAVVLGESELSAGSVTLRRLSDGRETSHALGDLDSLVREVRGDGP